MCYTSLSLLNLYVCMYNYTGAGIPPENVMVTVDSSTEISVQWGPLRDICRARNGIITGYIIQYRAWPNDVAVTTDEIDSFDFTLTGLTPFTLYSIEVAAVNEEGDVGVYSEPHNVITEEAGKSVYCGKCLTSSFLYRTWSSGFPHRISFVFYDHHHLGRTRNA